MPLKPKDKKAKGSASWSFLIEDPEKTKRLMKPHKLFEGSRNKEKGNSTSKNRSKLSKRPHWTKSSTRQAENLN
jgi:hypothetical protein